MGSIGAAEILVVLVVALLVLGPAKLPDAARQVGRAIGEFKRVTNSFQDEVRDTIGSYSMNAPPPSRTSNPSTPSKAPDSPPAPKPLVDPELPAAENGTRPDEPIH